MKSIIFFAIYFLYLTVSLGNPIGKSLKSEDQVEDVDNFLVTEENPLQKWSPTDPMNPEELGPYWEGDIILPENRNLSRNGLVDISRRWPNGVVPYEIDGSFSDDELEVIKKGMQEYHEKTCIQFVPHTDEEDYVSIINSRSGCWSSVGRVGGKQQINLQSPGCLVRVGTFIHEAMHALGFLHEQNRYERDDYVTINWQNIMPGTRRNFGRASSTSTYGFGIDYDYGSVMHYSAYAFSRNGKPTIEAKKNENKIILGQRRGFSKGDVQKLRKMYKCDNDKEGSSSPKPTSPSFAQLLGSIISNITH